MSMINYFVVRLISRLNLVPESKKIVSENFPVFKREITINENHFKVIILEIKESVKNVIVITLEIIKMPILN
jgi:hypothetical protein